MFRIGKRALLDAMSIREKGTLGEDAFRSGYEMKQGSQY